MRTEQAIADVVRGGSFYDDYVPRHCAAHGLDAAEFMNPEAEPAPAICPYCGRELRYPPLELPNGRQWGWRPIPDPCPNPECAEKTRNAREENERQARLAALPGKLQRAGVPPLYEQAKLCDMELVNSSVARARSEVADYLWHLEERCKEGAGLFLHGPVGSGKTHMAVAVLRETLQREHTGRFVQSSDLIREIQATVHSRENVQDVMAPYQNCKLLVLDDVGKEHATDWALNQLAALIGARYVSRRPTVCTSNFTLDELTDKLAVQGNTDSAKAIVSRIRDGVRVVKVVANDYRARVR